MNEIGIIDEGTEEKTEEDFEKLEEKMIEDLIKAFDHKYWEYSVEELIEWMNDKGHENIGRIIENNIKDDILQLSTIDDDATVWLMLNDQGLSLWNKYNRGKEGYSEDSEDSED